MEAFRHSLRQSLNVDTPEGTVCRKILCALQLLLASRWFVCVWQLRAIVPVPLAYGIGVLPALTLGGVVLPALYASCGCCPGACCPGRGVRCWSVLCGVLDVGLSFGLSIGLFKVADALTTEPDGTLNIYWSGTLHTFIAVLVLTCLGALQPRAATPRV
jgi:hypothetical protein